MIANKKLLTKAISTLAYSWGSDTPPEVFWGLYELVEFFEAEFEVTLPKPMEDNPDSIEELIDTIDGL